MIKDAVAHWTEQDCWRPPSRHRRGGGDAILHHRTLNPVVIRDWSRKVEVFDGALAQTANTTLNLRNPIPAKDPTALATTEWLRAVRSAIPVDPVQPVGQVT